VTDAELIGLVDARDFRTLFIDELGWGNPEQPNLQLEVDGMPFTLTQVAGYKGLRIWHCACLPPRKTQRVLDVLVGKDNAERLLIFTDERRQEWRWPRKAQLGGTNAKLLVHQHVTGQTNERLAKRLMAISLDFDEDLSLVALLDRMRDAFDAEAETASVQAARLMGTLYAELETAGVPERDATLLLARLLFLLFGDDADMWSPGLFQRFIASSTAPETLSADLLGLFAVLDTPEGTRKLAADDPRTPFRYINGQLYSAPLTLPALTSAFRDALAEACEFDWGIISPAIFGSMFQTVKSKEARRQGGEHYTTEENILKTIRPLFLDEFTERLESAWEDKAQLTRLHNDLGRLRFLDPACGCGNFLIVAYRELRALELELLKQRRDLDLKDGVSSGGVNRAQLTLDVTANIKVTLNHFYGIEIDEWPARIAETAMLLVDHLANRRMTEEFGKAPDRLPIAIAPTIKHDNALEVDWADLLAPSENVVILGNPPFIGQYTKTARQTADTRAIWGPRYNGYLDYVTCWYAKAIDYYGERPGRWAFVSTNSICQGEAVEFLWRPILDAGWRCRFAHRSFQWLSEATGGAGVHVSIVGFDKASAPKPALWTYAEGGKGKPASEAVPCINPYLVDAPNVLVSNRAAPLCPSLPSVVYGSKPTDGGWLLVGPDEYDEVAADPIAVKYLRRYVGARELLHELPRWCLWLGSAPREETRRSRVLAERVAAVQQMREASTDLATKRAAARPTLFQYDRQPATDYLAIPAHVGEHRRYFTAARFPSDVICSNANFLAPDPDGLVLGVLSSSMFIAWMRAIGGRLESRLRFSNTFTYNNFPLPELSARQRDDLVKASAGITAARAEHPGKALADLYEQNAMPAALIAAHEEVDRVVDRLFGRGDFTTLSGRQKALFRSYAVLTGQMSARTETISEQVGELPLGDRL
jgi:hypothetical protein